MAEPDKEKSSALKLFFVTFSAFCFTFLLGFTMILLHYCQAFISMDHDYTNYAENLGFSLLGLACGLLKISGTAYAYGHRKPLESLNYI